MCGLDVLVLLEFDDRESDSPYIERVWRSRSRSGGPFLSIAEGKASRADVLRDHDLGERGALRVGEGEGQGGFDGAAQVAVAACQPCSPVPALAQPVLMTRARISVFFFR